MPWRKGEAQMILFYIYMAAITGILWYTLGVLPFPELKQNFGFTLNIIQLGFLSLLSFLVYRQETHYRSIFFQFWALFAALALSAPVLYSLWHWFGDLTGAVAYGILLMVVHVMFAWIAAKLTLTYVFRDEKRWVVNLLSSLVVLPLFLWLFWPFWFKPAHIFLVPTAQNPATLYRPLEQPSIILNIVSLLILLAFFLHKLRTDRPLGTHIDPLLFLFGLFYSIDTAELLLRITSVELLHITQWANGLLAAGMIVTLLLRLKYKSQTLAEYYESQSLSTDPNIDRRIGLFDRVILWAFFNPKKIGKRIYLGEGRKEMTVKRSVRRIERAGHLK